MCLIVQVKTFANKHKLYKMVFTVQKNVKKNTGAILNDNGIMLTMVLISSLQ
jgi:hypothetical protein